MECIEYSVAVRNRKPYQEDFLLIAEIPTREKKLQAKDLRLANNLSIKYFHYSLLVNHYSLLRISNQIRHIRSDFIFQQTGLPYIMI